jgi:ParB-like chromosome segregation protein Spo0J
MARQPTASAARVGRLTGRGRSDDRGGGLSLPELFGPILTTLHERGDATEETLTAAVRSGFLGQKTARLQTIYDDADPWSAFITDALEQLSSRELVTRHESGHWSTGTKFAAGKPLIAISAGSGQPAVKVTVQTDEQRAERSGDETSMYITELASELDARRGGIRPLDTRRVEELVSSMEAFGFRTEPIFAVLKDQHGRVLDGRHRIAAAEKLGIEWDNKLHVQTVKVENDREALALTWTANVGQAGWTKSDLDRITRALGGESPAVVLSTKVQVRNTLLDQQGRITDREVARIVGCSPTTVGVYRLELEQAQDLVPFDPDAERRAAIREQLQRTPEASAREIARQVGTTKETVGRVKRELEIGGEDVQSGQALHEPEPIVVEQLPAPELTKHEQILRELAADPNRSDKEIGGQLGVHHSSVWRVRKKLAGQDPYNGSIEGPRPKPEPSQPSPAPASTSAVPGALELAWTEDARVLAGELSAWMTDANVLLELGNRLIATARRRGAS